MPISQVQNKLIFENMALSGLSAKDISGIPAWANKIIITIDQLSTNGSQGEALKIGTGGVVDDTGYSSVRFSSSVCSSISTDKFNLNTFVAASDSARGVIVLRRVYGNFWSADGSFFIDAATDDAWSVSGFKSLAGKLDIIRLVTGNGKDLFDAGFLTVEVSE